MRVYFVENESPNRDSSGGIMTYVINLSSFLMPKGFSTILLGTDEGVKPYEKHDFSEFINVCRQADVTNVKYIRSLFKAIPNLKFDEETIVHAQRPDMLFPFIFKGKLKNSICTLHGAHDLAVFDKKGKLYGIIYTLLQQIAFRKVTRLIAVDKHTAEHYIKKYPFVKDKIGVVPIGIDFKKFRPLSKTEMREKHGFAANDKIILYVGRLEKEKNVGFLLNSYQLVKERIPQVKLVLVGAGRDADMLKQQCKEQNISDVLFVGEIQNTMIPELMNCADVFAFSSLYEGSPTVIKEALACNLPVVSVNVGDVKDVIENLPGCFLAERDVTDFAGKIETVLSGPLEIDIRTHISQFDRERIGEQTFVYYQPFLKSKA